MNGSQWGDEVVRHVGKRRVEISGRFFPQGAGAVVNSSNKGKKGWSVAHVAVGQFRLTLEQHWLAYVLKSVALQLAVAAGQTVVFGPIVTTGTQPTIDIFVVDAAGAAVDVAADANNSISFCVECVQDGVQG